jgi:serine/threonine protein kinase
MFGNRDPFKKYRNMREIGRGGNGIVHSAVHDRLGPVILKQVQNDNFGANERDMLRRVADANRPAPRHVCRIYDAFVVKMDLYLVLEPFEAILDKYRWDQASPYSLLNIALETAKGLLEMERAGVIDDDVKPENIGMTADGRIAHIDLGAARLSGQPPFGYTEGFVSPEVLDGNPSDTSPAHGWGRSMEFFAVGQHGLAPDTRLVDVHPWLGTAFSALIFECCSGRPEDRPSAAALVDRLRAIRSDTRNCGSCPEGYRRFGDAPCFRCGGTLSRERAVGF